MNKPSRVKRNAEMRERAAASEVVPGFPELVAREAQCQICALVEDDPAFLKQIHDVARGGAGVKRLETSMGPDWMKRTGKVLDHRSYDRHLKRHVAFDAVPVGAGLMVAIPPVPPVEVREVDGDAIEYFDMENLLTQLRTRMREIDKHTVIVGIDGKIDHYGTTTWLRLVSEFRASIESLARMKNSDRLTKAILQAHTKRMAQMVATPLVARFNSVIRDLRANEPGALDQLEKLAGADMKTLILGAAEAAIEESCEVYNLH